MSFWEPQVKISIISFTVITAYTDKCIKLWNCISFQRQLGDLRRLFHRFVKRNGALWWFNGRLEQNLREKQRGFILPVSSGVWLGETK